VTLDDWGSLVFSTFELFGFSFANIEYFDFERTGWILYKKCVVRTKFDIYVFMTLDIEPLAWEYD